MASGQPIDLAELLLILLGALSAHASVNLLNEYLDFSSGLDLHTQRTPFSGGSGALPGQPSMKNAVLVTGLLTLAVTVVVGCMLVHRHGWALVPPGLAGVALVVLYTGWINRHPVLCLLAPGTGFGLLMVAGSAYVLQGQYLPLSWLAGLVPFFQVNNLLLINQYPDIDADRMAGRRHLPIVYGTTVASRIYALFALAAAVTVVAGVFWSVFPMLSLAALVPMMPAFHVYRVARGHAGHIAERPACMAVNVAITLLTPLVLAATIIVG